MASKIGKKALVLSLCAAIFGLMLVTNAVFADSRQNEVSVQVNGLLLTGVIKDGKTLVPLRGIFEALGANVEWDSHTQTAKATKDHPFGWEIAPLMWTGTSIPLRSLPRL